MTTPGVDVAHLILKFDKGGLEMTTLNLCRGLRARGYTSAVVAMDGGGETLDLARREGFDCVALSGRRIASPRFHARVLHELRRLRPRVVHTHHFSSLLNSFPAGALSRPFHRVHTEHSCQYLTEQPRHRRTLRWASRRVDVFVSVASSMARFYADEVGVAPTRLRVIPNGIDTDRFQPVADRTARDRLRRRLGIPEGIVVGAVGRLADVKNYELALRAIAGLRSHCPDLSLVLIGDGENRAALEQQARQLGLEGRVLFPGWRHDTDDWLRAFDIFALTSTSEALPLAVLEAMATGLPIVSTAVGDVTGLVNEAGCGSCVPVGDDPGYVAALGDLLMVPDQRLEFGRKARKYVVHHHSIEAMVTNYLSAYDLRRD